MAISTRAWRSPLVVVLTLLSGGLACESSSDAPRDAGVEDGGRRDSDGGDAAAATDSGELDGDVPDARDGDGSVDEPGDPDGGDSGPDEPDETLPLGSYCEQVAALYFDYLQECYGKEPYPDSLRQERVEQYRARCMQVEGAIEAGRVAFDEREARGCVEQLEVGGCARQFEGCTGVFRGLLSPGDDCYIEETLIFMVGVSACRDGYCDEGAACPGTCRALPERGEECDQGRCRDEDYCDADDMCRARSGPGEACAEWDECESGLLCTGDEGERLCQRPVLREGGSCSETAPCGGITTCIDGECTFARSLGEVCSLHSQCPDGARCIFQECAEPGGAGDLCVGDRDCEAGLLCNISLAEPECVALPEIGEPCVRERCVAGASCRYDVDDGDGTCRAQVGQGESCMVGVIRDDNRCQEGLHCIEAGTCEPPGELGEPCGTLSPKSCVDGLWCSRQTHTCEAPVGQGDACNPYWPSTCEEGLGCACGLDDLEQCFSFVREHQASDTCQPLVAGEGECFRPAECASGTCSADFEGPNDVPGTCAASAPICLP